MNILHFISDIRRGGRERQLSILMSYPIPQVEQHIIAFYKISNSYLDEYNLNDIEYISENKLLRLIELYKFINSKNIDIIYSWGGGETVYALIVSLFSKVKFINGSIRHGVKRKGLKNKFTYFLLKFSKYIISNSYAGLDAYNLNSNKATNFVIYNGIEDKFFINHNEIQKEQFLKLHAFDNKATIFISIANLVAHKDYIPTLYALKALRNEGYSFYYVIIGKGPMIDNINLKIKELGLNENISIFDNDPNIPELLSLSDIFIHSSAGEGCSNAILEAKAAGLIVVASNTGGTKEIIGNYGFLFQYKDVEEMKKKIKQAIAVLEIDKYIRKKIQLETRESYSIETFQKRYLETIQKIMSQ